MKSQTIVAVKSRTDFRVRNPLEKEIVKKSLAVFIKLPLPMNEQFAAIQLYKKVNALIVKSKNKKYIS